MLGTCRSGLDVRFLFQGGWLLNDLAWAFVPFPDEYSWKLPLDFAISGDDRPVHQYIINSEGLYKPVVIRRTRDRVRVEYNEIGRHAFLQPSAICEAEDLGRFRCHFLQGRVETDLSFSHQLSDNFRKSADAARGERPVFFAQKGGRGTSGAAIIFVAGEATYTQDGTGRPVLAQESSISVLEEAGSRVAEEDDQLSAMYPALVVDGITVGMAKPSSSALRLRIYHGATRADFLVQKERFCESVGIYGLGNSLTFCSTLKDTTIGIYSWIC